MNKITKNERMIYLPNFSENSKQNLPFSPYRYLRRKLSCDITFEMNISRINR